MSDARPYKRIMLKLSGEMLVGEQSMGIQPAVIGRFADEIKEIHANLNQHPNSNQSKSKVEIDSQCLNS